MDQATFEHLVHRLAGDQTPPVWSLMVTVFGELGQAEEARISSALLGQLMDLAGVKPEAMRVALHRLKKDGWLDSLRRGRASDYFLTPYGRSQSFQASPRIYDTAPPAEYAWLVLVDPAAPPPLADSTGVWLNPTLMITNSRPVGDDLFTTALGPDTQLPAWMAAKLCDPATVSLSASLALRFAEVHATLLRSPAPNPLERALLRVLIVHGWRRVALKAPALPDHLFSKRWRGADCRARFGQLLDQLPKPELDELQPDFVEAPST